MILQTNLLPQWTTARKLRWPIWVQNLHIISLASPLLSGGRFGQPRVDETHQKKMAICKVWAWACRYAHPFVSFEGFPAERKSRLSPLSGFTRLLKMASSAPLPWHCQSLTTLQIIHAESSPGVWSFLATFITSIPWRVWMFAWWHCENVPMSIFGCGRRGVLKL